MAEINLSKRIFRLFLTLAAVSLLLALITGYIYWSEKQQQVEAAKTKARSEARRAAQKIDQQLSLLKNTATTIAKELSEGKLKQDDEILQRLKAATKQNPSLNNTSVTFVPYAYNSSEKLHRISCYPHSGGTKKCEIKVPYDYTQPEYLWYHRPLQEGALWLNPYFGKVSQTIVVSFATPFYQIEPKTQQRQVAGVVTANYSLNQVQKLMNSLDLEKTGYAFIVSKQGAFLYNPARELVKNKSNILNYYSKPRLRSLVKKALDGERITLSHKNQDTGLDSWLLFEPLQSSGLTLVAVIINQDALHFQSLNRILIWISLELIILAISLSIILFKAYQGIPKQLWAVSNTTALLLATAIGFILYLKLKDGTFYQDDNVLLLNTEVVNEYLNDYHLLHTDEENPVYIPTGVFIQTLEFQDANDVFVSGYIWQKYSKNIPKDISRGFFLPEAVDDPKINLYYQRQIDDYEVIGWHFEAKLRQSFDYSQYPFDSQDVWLRFWHRDFDKNVILTPDLEAYDMINPLTFPGIEQKDFVLPGWDKKASFFEYRKSDYNTNFGIKNYIGQKDFPELYYTIHLKRDFLTIFIGNLLIPIVIAFLLFFLQLLFIKSKENGEESDFEALEIVSACSAFLFILIIDQINLRQKIITAGILYLDYFYFVLYLVIISLAINGILFIYGKNIKIIQYKNNLIPKLLYWPNLLTTLLIITLSIFY